MKLGARHLQELARAHVSPYGKPFKGVQVRCRDCEKTCEVDTPSGSNCLPTNIILKKMRQKGWLVGPGHKARCPEHAVNPVRYRTLKVETPAPPPDPVRQPLKEINAMSQPTATISNIQPSFKLVRAVMDLLAEHFDEKSRRYKTGWGDEKIAKETGVHVGQVAKIRTDAFGDLADDPGMAAFQDKLADYELRAEAMLIEAKKLSAEFQSFVDHRKIAG